MSLSMYIYFIYFKVLSTCKESLKAEFARTLIIPCRLANLGYWWKIFPATNPSQSTINVAHVGRATHIENTNNIAFFPT